MSHNYTELLHFSFMYNYSSLKVYRNIACIMTFAEGASACRAHVQWNLRKRTLPRMDIAPRADSCAAPVCISVSRSTDLSKIYLARQFPWMDFEGMSNSMDNLESRCFRVYVFTAELCQGPSHVLPSTK